MTGEFIALNVGLPLIKIKGFKMQKTMLMSTLASIFTLQNYTANLPDIENDMTRKKKRKFSTKGTSFTRGKRHKSLKSRANRRK